MAKKIKFGKISVTVFLTALIWVWADLAQDAPLELAGVVKLTVSNPSDPNLWIALEESEGRTLRQSLTFKSVTLKGPAWRIDDVERRINRKELLLDLFVVPDQMGLTGTETRTFESLSFLKQRKEIQDLGLTVEACEPTTFTVQARRLSIVDVAVECIDASGGPVAVERIDPERVKMRVPSGDIAVARVRLTAAEQKLAGETPVEKTPYIQLADGTLSNALGTVKVKLPPVDDGLRPSSVSATLGFCMSQNLQHKYQVVLQKDPSVDPVQIRATVTAKQEYEAQPFQMLLYIDDADVKPGQEYTTRPVVFNFPEEYVRKGEIQLAQDPVRVQFRLVPLAPPPATPASVVAP